MYSNAFDFACTPELSCPSEVATEHQISQIAKFLPTIYKTKAWQLAYSRSRSGTSLSLLYRNLRDTREAVLIIKDSERHVFGAFCPEPLAARMEYFGSGETFLYSFGSGETVDTFHWTTKNPFFIYADADGFGFGADPGFGLFIDKELLKGHSAQCQTFDNPVLAASRDFDIAKLEIWALVDELEVPN
eukprot:TRINITY_DN8281_c0_g1_i2.p1 TRINITY_DN8281_c0_g1~~TRINITY_DN8281_c0_g1_i2.p1  ORF type:complete len:188 (-),score=28.62 TRINITY_DN8281_c0_g1_i2:4-567(-)